MMSFLPAQMRWGRDVYVEFGYGRFTFHLPLRHFQIAATKCSPAKDCDHDYKAWVYRTLISTWDLRCQLYMCWRSFGSASTVAGTKPRFWNQCEVRVVSTNS